MRTSKYKGFTINEELDQVRQAAQAIFDKKGSNILGVDLRQVSSITDYCLIAEGTVDRHLNTLADAVMAVLGNPYMHEGTGGWIVLDYGTVMIHLMDEETRDYYRIEELWREGSIVDLQIKTGATHA